MIKLTLSLWVLAGFAVSIDAKSTLKPSETLDASHIADSLKKAVPTAVVTPRPVVNSTSVSPDVVNRDSVTAKQFRVLDRQMNPETIKYFLNLFRFKDFPRPESTAVNMSWRDQRGGVLSYETGTSEVGYMNENIAVLTEKDLVPDTLIRNRTNDLIKTVLGAKAESYVFANYEITEIQKKIPDSRDSLQPPVPAYYFGRYVRSLENRVVLGDAFQIRIGYGENGAIQSFSFRDPELAEAGTIKVPSKEMVMDTLKKWEKSKTHSRAYYFPYHPDHLNIRSLKPIKVFDSYVLTMKKFRDDPKMDGMYLVPSVTVLAKVVLSTTKKKLTEPLPSEPTILHFHFPCRPEAGLCWPDGKQTLEEHIPASSRNTPSSSMPSPNQAPTEKPVIPTPSKQQLPFKK